MSNEENIYSIIAGNIRRERKRLCLSQARLAERADISIDTIKSVERGKRAMSLDTYLRIVQALETTPLALMNKEQSEGYIERFFVLVHNFLSYPSICVRSLTGLTSIIKFN